MERERQGNVQCLNGAQRRSDSNIWAPTDTVAIREGEEQTERLRHREVKRVIKGERQQHTQMRRAENISAMLLSKVKLCGGFKAGRAVVGEKRGNKRRGRREDRQNKVCLRVIVFDKQNLMLQNWRSAAAPSWKLYAAVLLCNSFMSWSTIDTQTVANFTTRSLVLLTRCLRSIFLLFPLMAKCVSGLTPKEFGDSL